MEDDELKYLQRRIDELQEQLDELKEQHENDDDAIENEFELVWDSINELQGVDPEKIGEPIENKKHSIFNKARKYFTAK